MGLGPPVCMDCMMLGAYNEAGNPSWWCVKCKKSLDRDYRGSLFTLTDQELAQVDANCGTKLLEERQYDRARRALDRNRA